MSYMVVTTYLLMFFTDYLGLSPVAAGTVFLVALIFDAISDPCMGIIADRSRTRFGSYRHWILACAVPYGLTTFLLFVCPDFSYIGKLIWAYVIYLLYTVFCTIVQVPYGSMVTVMTDDDNQRGILGAFRDWGANLGAFILNMFAITMIVSFGGGEMNATGFKWMGLVCGIATTVAVLLTFFGTKERLTPEKSNTNVKQAIKSLGKNKPALCILCMVFFINFFIGFKAAFTTYYGVYYLGNENSIATILTVMYTLPLLGILFVPKLRQILGARIMFIISGIFAAVSGVLSLIAGQNMILIIISSVAAGITVSGVFSNIWGSMPDAADYGELKTGIHAPGFIYAMATFAIKLSYALSSYAAGWVLNGIGYDETLAVQSAATNNGIFLVYGIVPIVVGVLGILCILPYRLTAAKAREVQVQLAAKRAGKPYEIVDLSK